MTLINQSSELWQYVAEIGCVILHEHQTPFMVDNKSSPWYDTQGIHDYPN